MLRSILTSSLLILTAQIGLSEDRLDESGFTPLFDGKSFAGWEGNLKWFRIEDSAIVAGSLKERIPTNFFLATEESFGDFELRLDAKLYGQGKNAGIQIRTKRIPNHTEVSGYQADMGIAGKNPCWGSLYDESRRRKFLAQADSNAVSKILKKEGEWNSFRIRCKGAKIEIWLNGLKTVDYTEKDPEIDRDGIIALQIHSGPPAEAAYRNIRIKSL